MVCSQVELGYPLPVAVGSNRRPWLKSRPDWGFESADDMPPEKLWPSPAISEGSSAAQTIARSHHAKQPPFFRTQRH